MQRNKEYKVSINIKENPNGSFYVKELRLDKPKHLDPLVIRSPFNTIKEALKREMDILKEYHYKKSEIAIYIYDIRQ